MQSLYKSLVEYSNDEYYPMHMPGHKRNSSIMEMINPYQIDITEIDGFDNLHDANDLLKDAMKRASKLYHSEHTYFLVNGSTVGILSAINAVTNKNDTVIVARNCHKAVYHAIYLNQLNPIYVYPQLEQGFEINGGISPQNIERLLIKHPETKLIIVTSPSYEGIISDIDKIACIAHQYSIPIMVDEAHGAHLGFHNSFPKTSISKNADIVIHSVHKTLPAFTQTALLHINGNRVDNKKIEQMLSIYESSSPSYILMASIDQCMELLEEKAEELFEVYTQRLNDFHKGLQLKNLKVLNKDVIKQESIYDLDPSKIVISTKNTLINGKELYEILLHKYKIQLEMASKEYVIAMTSICDTKEGFNRLQSALNEIDINLMKLERMDGYPYETVNYGYNYSNWNYENMQLSLVYNIYDALQKEAEEILLKDGVGRIAADYIYLYPPGIPIIVPGEEITGILVEKLIEYKRKRLDVKGLKGLQMDKISVLKYQ